MAGLFGPGFYVDYAITDGRVRHLEIGGLTLVDEGAGVAVEGWEGQLVALVEARGLNHEPAWPGLPGFYAFVRRLADQGKVTLHRLEKRLMAEGPIPREQWTEDEVRKYDDLLDITPSTRGHARDVLAEAFVSRGLPREGNRFYLELEDAVARAIIALRS